MSGSSVADAWARIEAWLHDNAPASHATLLPPAADAADLLQRHAGAALEPDLLDYALTVGGSDRSPAGLIFPHGRALSAREAIEQATMRLEIYDDLVQDNPDMRAGTRRGLAGDMAWSWERELLPVTDDTNGDGLFADLRRGPSRGCIKAWSHEQGGLYPPLWSGVVEMLDDIASTLEQDGSCHGWEPHVTDGTLRWDFPASAVTTTYRDELSPEIRERLFPSGADLPVAEPDEVDLTYMQRMRDLEPRDEERS